MYPKDYRSPLNEGDLLQAPLEPTNEGYAISKISGAKLCEYISNTSPLDYRTIIPCNLYGPGDSFSTHGSHLIASIIQKISHAIQNGNQTVEIWGDGEARREFLFIDDLANFFLDHIDQVSDWPQYLNLGAGKDYTVNEYYRTVAEVLGFKGTFEHDLSRPVGMKRKLLDSSLANTHGWSPHTTLTEGIQRSLNDFNSLRP